MIRLISAIAALFLSANVRKQFEAHINEHPDRLKATTGLFLSIGSSFANQITILDGFQIVVQVLGGVGGLYYLYLGIKERRLKIREKQSSNKVANE